MMGLVVGGLFAVGMTGVLAWVFFRLARREAEEQKRLAATKGKADVER
jgi:hypothetical protein